MVGAQPWTSGLHRERSFLDHEPVSGSKKHWRGPPERSAQGYRSRARGKRVLLPAESRHEVRL